MATKGKMPTALLYYKKLKKVNDYVMREIDQDITLGSAARIACLEKKYFSAFFRQKTGMCFTHWLTELRVNRAMELIAYEDCLITNAATAVGFRDLRTFERAFKKQTGMTPRAFKSLKRPA